MSKRQLPSEDQGALDLGLDFDIPEDPSVQAGKVSNAIFRPWYKEYYEGRYGQSVGSIVATLKRFILRTVIEGDFEQEDVKDAIDHLGKGQKPVTEMSLQYALELTQKRKASKRNHGAFDNVFQDEDFQDIIQNTYDIQAEDYGTSETGF